MRRRGPELAGGASLDEASRWILRRLRGDGRASLAEMARGLKLSVTSVRHRVAWLEESGILCGYRAVIDPAKAGRGCRARIRLKAGSSEIRPLAERLARYEEVDSVRLATGAFPLDIEVAVTDSKALGLFLRKALPGIRAERYEVDLFLEIVKE